MWQELDAEVEWFRNRKLDGDSPDVWLDATFVQVRDNGRVASMVEVIAIGVKATGEREVLGLDVGHSEDGAFWTQFQRGLVARGLRGVTLVISDAHEGRKGAVAAVLQGAAWQRCRVHFVRNALALVPKAAAQMVAATIRTVFVQPDPASAREQWRRVAESLRPRFPRLAHLMDEAEADVLASLAFPLEHWRQLWSTNPLERLNKEVRRRTDVVGIFPNQASVIRLAEAELAEQHEEWQVSRRYFSAEPLAKLNTGKVTGPAGAMVLPPTSPPAPLHAVERGGEPRRAGVRCPGPALNLLVLGLARLWLTGGSSPAAQSRERAVRVVGLSPLQIGIAGSSGAYFTGVHSTDCGHPLPRQRPHLAGGPALPQ